MTGSSAAFRPAAPKWRRDLYQAFVKGEMHLTNARTAELAKLVENAFRDVNIAFANELSNVCEKVGVNVWELIELANEHPRVNILKPGPGVGGHCIAVDPWFIVAAARDESKIMRAAREVNDHKPHAVVEKVKTAAERLRQPVIACLGLSYKADIDDLRESPALDIVEHLAATVSARSWWSSRTSHSCRRVSRIPLGQELGSCDRRSQAADIIVLLVDHRQFKRVDRELLNLKIVVDTRGLWH